MKIKGVRSVERELKNRNAVFKTGLFGILPALILFTFSACDSITDIPAENPHPPTISNPRVSPTVLRPGGSFTYSVDYQDAGADVVSVFVEDKNSSFATQGTPPADDDGNPLFFPGTSGTATFTVTGFSGRQLGSHTLVFWLVDSEDSLSNQVESTITVVP